MLNNAVVAIRGAHQLAAFPPVVRAWLFDVNIFAGLARPDRHQAVPVVGSGDGNRIDGFVVENLANVEAGFWRGLAHFFNVRSALSEHAFVDIAKSRQLNVGQLGIRLDVLKTSPTESADGHANAVIGAENLF